MATAAPFAPVRRSSRGKVAFLVGNVGGLSEPVSHQKDTRERREMVQYETLTSWVDAIEKGYRVPVRVGHDGRVIGEISNRSGDVHAHRITGLAFRLPVDDFDEMACGELCGVSLGFSSAEWTLRTIDNQLVREIKPGAYLDHIAIVKPPLEPCYRLGKVKAVSANAAEIEKTTRELQHRTFRAMKLNRWVWWT